MNVTVLGGAGLLGRNLIPLLVERGHRVVVTRSSSAPGPVPGAKTVHAQLETGDGLAEAVAGADVVVHLASDPLHPEPVDVAGTERLLPMLGDRHLVYVSIVGVDRHPLPYYRAKLATENLIAGSGVGHTILRATQFHDFIAWRIGNMTRGRVARIAWRYVYQPVDVAEVAEELARIVDGPPSGKAPDFAGPQILGIEHLTRSLLAAQSRRRRLVPVPSFTAEARAFRAGAHTNPERAVGRVTWGDYLLRRFGAAEIS